MSNILLVDGQFKQHQVDEISADSGSYNLDTSEGNVHKVSVSESGTLVDVSPMAPTESATHLILFEQDSTGHEVTLPASFVFAEGSPSVVPSGPSKRCLLTALWVDSEWVCILTSLPEKVIPPVSVFPDVTHHVLMTVSWDSGEPTLELFGETISSGETLRLNHNQSTADANYPSMSSQAFYCGEEQMVGTWNYEDELVIGWDTTYFDFSAQQDFHIAIGALGGLWHQIETGETLYTQSAMYYGAPPDEMSTDLSRSSGQIDISGDSTYGNVTITWNRNQ